MTYVLPLSQADKKLLHARQLRATDPLADVDELKSLHLTGILNGENFAVEALLADAFICLLEANALTETYNQGGDNGLDAFSIASHQLQERLDKLMSHYEHQLEQYQLLHDQVRANFYAIEPDDLTGKLVDGSASKQELAFHALLGLSADAEWCLEVAMQIIRILNPAQSAADIQHLSGVITQLVESE